MIAFYYVLTIGNATTTAIPSTTITTVDIQTPTAPYNTSKSITSINSTTPSPTAPYDLQDIRDALQSSIQLIATQQISEELLIDIINVASVLSENSETKSEEYSGDLILISQLLDTISKHSGNFVQNYTNNTTILRATSTIALQVDFVSIAPLTSRNRTTINISFPTSVNESRVPDTATIPISFLNFIANTTNNSQISVITYVIRVRTNRSEPLAVNQIVSNIFGLTILGIEPETTLIQPIRINFQTNRTIENPLCSFLIQNTSVWSQFGLELVESTQNTTVCETYHLTSFAVLAGSTIRYSDIELLLLKVITYALLIVSLIFLLTSLGALVYSSKLVFKIEANLLYFNLGLALTLAILTFIVGTELHQLSTPIPCFIVSLFIHYFWLTVFTSSSALAILIFQVTWLSVVESRKRFIALFLIISAWIIPLIITVAIAVPLIIEEDDILNTLSNNSCILSPKNAHAIPFYIVICLMIILNAGILFLALIKILASSNNTNLIIYRTITVSALTLLPILGVSWIIVPIIAFCPTIKFLSSFLDWIFIFLNGPVGVAFFVITMRIEDMKLPFKKATKSTAVKSNTQSAQQSKMPKTINALHPKPVYKTKISLIELTSNTITALVSTTNTTMDSLDRQLIEESNNSATVFINITAEL